MEDDAEREAVTDVESNPSDDTAGGESRLVHDARGLHASDESSKQIMNRFTARMIFHTPCLDMVEEVGLNFKRVLLSLKLDLIFFFNL